MWRQINPSAVQSCSDARPLTKEDHPPVPSDAHTGRRLRGCTKALWRDQESVWRQSEWWVI